MPLDFQLLEFRILGYQLHDLTGNLGVALVLGTCFLLPSEKLRIDSIVYPSLNAPGAVMIGYSLLFYFSLSSMIIGIVWFSISIHGLTRLLRRRRQDADAIGQETP